MAFALLSASGSAAAPETVPAAATPLVLAGRGSRPVWSFVVSAPDGAGDLGSATADWTPSGGAVCPASPVPFGAHRTDVAVAIDGPAALSGRTIGRLESTGDGCASAAGSWRGVSGALRGRG
jgi:hypothetical protein